MRGWPILAVLAAGAGLFVLSFDRTAPVAPTGAALPDFAAAAVVTGKSGLASADLRDGQPRLLNIFASWCGPCESEAPQLMALARTGVAIDAIAVRDTAAGVAGFLMRHGDPYQRIGDDPDSRAQLALGSDGVPQTLVVDGQGRIVRRHVGAITPADLPWIASAVRDAR